MLRTNVYIHDTTNTENTNAVVFWHWLHTRRHIERIIWVPCHSRGVGIHFEDGVVYFEYMPDSCRNNNGMSLVCSNLSCHIYNFVMKYCLNGLWKCPYAWQKKTSRTQRTKCLVINYILFVLLGLFEEYKKKTKTFALDCSWLHCFFKWERSPFSVTDIHKPLKPESVLRPKVSLSYPVLFSTSLNISFPFFLVPVFLYKSRRLSPTETRHRKPSNFLPFGAS